MTSLKQLMDQERAIRAKISHDLFRSTTQLYDEVTSLLEQVFANRHLARSAEDVQWLWSALVEWESFLESRCDRREFIRVSDFAERSFRTSEGPPEVWRMATDSAALKAKDLFPETY